MLKKGGRLGKKIISLYLDETLIEKMQLKAGKGKTSDFINKLIEEKVNEKALDLNEMADAFHEADKNDKINGDNDIWMRIPFKVKVRIAKRSQELYKEGWCLENNPVESIYQKLRYMAIEFVAKNNVIVPEDIDMFDITKINGIICSPRMAFNNTWRKICDDETLYPYFNKRLAEVGVDYTSVMISIHNHVFEGFELSKGLIDACLNEVLYA